MADTARVSVTVAVPPSAAFEIFTNDIDRWWRRGLKFRHAGSERGFLRLEPLVGGRLFESIGHPASHVVEVGQVRIWEPPHLLVFSWRSADYADDEFTEVEVRFKAASQGTLVTVTHRGFESLRADHPVRHGLHGAGFNRMIGMWWSDQMTAYREYCRAHRVETAAQT